MPSTFARVGIAGLGLMGSACAARLSQAGFALAGYDVDAARRAAFVAEGRRAAASVAALAACDAVVLAVFDTDQVEAVLEGEGGLIEAGRAASRLPLVVCTSTCDPDRIAALAQRCRAAGLSFIEMPISGTSASLAKGDAVGLVAGEEIDVARAASLLNALCAQRHYLGAAGQGGRAKLAVNLVLGLNRGAMAEGLVFAQRLGLEPERFLQVLIGSAAYSRVMEVKGPMMATRSFEPPQSKVGQSQKDFALILEQAAAHGQALPFAQVYAGLMAELTERGDAGRDNALIVEAVERCRAAS
jgi:3-hydroxyisobutyrate dehydrogenase-like beta-hydroxyacid dehydrogenase